MARVFFPSNYYLEAGTYTLITNLNTSIYKYAVGIGTKPYPTPVSYVYDTGWQTSDHVTFTIDQRGYLGVGVAKSDGTSSLTPSDISSYYFMLYKGSYDNSIPYSPYQSQSYTIDLDDLELCKIGTYKDYLYKSGDKWYKHGAVGKVVADGTNFKCVYLFGTGCFIVYDTEHSSTLKECVASGNDLGIKSNYLTSNTYHNIFDLGNVGVCGNSSKEIVVNIGITSSKEDVNTWLGTHNTIIYFPLATATDTEITNTTLIAQLEAVKLLSGTQNNFSIDADILPTLNINYIGEANPHL